MGKVIDENIEQNGAENSSLGNTPLDGKMWGKCVVDGSCTSSVNQKVSNPFSNTHRCVGLIELEVEALPPKFVVGFFDVQEDRHSALTTVEAFGNVLVDANQLVDSGTVASEASLGRMEEIVGFEKPVEPLLHQSLHKLAHAAEERDGTIAGWIFGFLVRLGERCDDGRFPFVRHDAFCPRSVKQR